MRKLIGIAGVLAVTLSMAGCLEKETTHTLYLSPDGAVAWTTLEHNVQSAENNVSARNAEEAQFLASAVAGTNDVANGLAALEPIRVQTRVLRRERPFTVMTEARFASAEELANRIMAAFRIPGNAYISREADSVTLHIHLDLRALDDGEDDKTPVEALVDELSTYRIVLTDGRFVAATGFSLNDNKTIATPIAAPEDQVKAVFDLSLTWR